MALSHSKAKVYLATEDHAHTWENSSSRRGGLHHCLVNDSIEYDNERSLKVVNHVRTKEGSSLIIIPYNDPASEAICKVPTGERDSTYGSKEQVTMASLEALAAASASGKSSASFFFPLGAALFTGMCWKMQSNMHGLIFSCIYRSTFSLIMEDDGSDCRCDNNNAHAMKTST